MRYIKSQIILLMIFWGTSFNVNAQYQSIFGANQTSWKYTYFSCLGCLDIDSASVIYGSDTMIQGKSFRKVSPLQSSNNFLQDFYLGEDTTLGQVYSYDPNIAVGQFQIISDLSLQLGDTVKSTFGIVDSVYFSNGLKHVRTNVGTMIEGVGVSWGVNLRGFSSNDGLLCQIKDGVTNFTGNHPNLNCQSSIITSIEETISHESKTLIQPNPASRFVNIVNQENDIVKIEFIDLNGSFVKTIDNPEARIGIDDLSNGIYMIRIHSKGKTTSVKLIIAR